MNAVLVEEVSLPSGGLLADAAAGGEGGSRMVRLRLREGVALVRDAHQGGPVYLRRQGHPLEIYEDVWGAPEEVQEAWERYLELRALEEEVLE